MYKHRVWLHIVLWAGLYFFWVAIFQNRALAFSRTMTVQFCYLIFISANYYLQVYWVIPRYLYRKKYVSFLLTLAGGIILGALLRVPLAIYLGEHYIHPGVPSPGFSSLFASSLLNIFVWVICLVAARLVFEKIRFRKYIDTIEKENTKNELDFLKAQFNPHFLFNSINSIYGHIDRKNAVARNMLLSFSEMLRYQLYECNVDYIGIDKEIGYIRNYVALQQVRKEENLHVSLDIPANVSGFRIAPLLFIAFIENAFKYVGNREGVESKVEISLYKKEDQLIFRSYNTIEHTVHTREHTVAENGMDTGRNEDDAGRNGMDAGGIGIANVRRRLDLQYPGRYELLTRDKEDSYEILLNLQITYQA
jgi:two-component system, LytTR family, sensor kinase